MPLFFVVGLVLLYALVRVGWLVLRHGVSTWCRRSLPRAPSWLAPWMERQAAWSFAAAWKKLWES